MAQANKINPMKISMYLANLEKGCFIYGAFLIHVFLVYESSFLATLCDIPYIKIKNYISFSRNDKLYDFCNNVLYMCNILNLQDHSGSNGS